MLTTLLWVVFSVSLMKCFDCWIQVRDNKERAWKEEDDIPDAMD